LLLRVLSSQEGWHGRRRCITTSIFLFPSFTTCQRCLLAPDLPPLIVDQRVARILREIEGILFSGRGRGF
jgi:hypothetical protein